MSAGQHGWIPAAAGGAAVASLAVLWSVGVRSWVRTAGLRRGSPSHVRAPDRPNRSSPTTWLAAATGLALLVWAGLDRSFDGALRIAVALAATAIAASGIRSRVTAVEASEDALVVRRAFRPPVLLPWPDVRVVRGPATPLGGWRFQAGARSITLMPSDLLGNEGVISIAIERGGLRFEGGRWTRPP